MLFPWVLFHETNPFPVSGCNQPTPCVPSFSTPCVSLPLTNSCFHHCQLSVVNCLQVLPIPITLNSFLCPVAFNHSLYPIAFNPYVYHTAPILVPLILLLSNPPCFSSLSEENYLLQTLFTKATLLTNIHCVFYILTSV